MAMDLITFTGTMTQALTAAIGTDTKVTITDSGYNAANLVSINTLTALPIVLKMVASQTLNGNATTIIDALAGINYTGAIIVTGAPTAAELNAIAKSTTGKVTATLDPNTPITLATVEALNGVKATDSITFIPAATTVSGTSELTALINLKKLLPNANFSGVDTLEGTSENVADIKSALNIATNAAVEITAGKISAADANAIAKATDGALTAEIKDGSVAATLKALANVDAADVITFKTTDTTVDASDLVALKAKVDTFTVDSVTTITENATTIGVAAKTVTDALVIANNAAVKITGTISATNAGLIATATAGVVTANITADSAAALKAALTGANLDDALTLTILKGTATAADLNDLNALTSVAVNASAITEITALAADVAKVTDLYAANAAKTVSGLGNEAIKIAGTISATDANTIAKLTTGVVTASVTGVNAATAANLVAALTDAKATDALTLEVLTGTVAASDLKALDAKTSIAVDANVAGLTITGTAADVKTVLAASGITLDKTNVAITIDPTTKISAADANTITGATFGKVTAEVAAGTAAALNKALTNAAGTDDLTLTISKGTAAASDLIALDTKTNLAVKAEAVTTITGIASDVNTVLTAAGIDTATNVAVTLSGTVSAGEADGIADKTTGAVTATIAAGTAAALNIALVDATAGANAYTLTVNNAAGVSADAVDLLSLDTKTSVKVKVDAVDVNGDYSELEQVYVTNKAGFANLGNENVTIDNAVLASQINTIAKATTGIVTATVEATAADLVANLKDANATDKLTLTVTGEAKASDLNTLDGKTSEDVIIKANATVIGNIADVTKVFVTNKDNFTNEDTTAVTISGTVTAAQADAIAYATSKAVTATIAAGTATALNTALANAVGTDKLTLTVNGTTAAVADLNTLKGKTSEDIKVDAKEITGTGALLEALYTPAAGFTNLGNENVKVDAGASLANLNAIAKATTGVVTATVTEANATAVNTALADLGTGGLDKLTLVLTGSAVAADLKALDAKTSVVVDAKGVTTITGLAADVKTVLAATGIDTTTTVKADVSGTISAADANTISKATTGEVKATVTADTAAALKSALAGVSNDEVDALTLTVNGTTAAAADLIALDAKTSVDVVVNATTVTGNITDLTSVYVSANGFTTGDEAVTISGTVSATQADVIADATTGVVTATITAGTAAALSTALVTNGDATVNAYKLTVNNDNTTTLATDLTGLDGKTSVAVDAHLVTDISGSSVEVLAAYVANTAGTITGLGNETVTITDAAATVANVSAINTATSGLVDVAKVDVTAATFSLTDLGLLTGITGLTTIDAATSTNVSTLTLNLADLLAANDGASFNIAVKLGAEDTLNLLSTDNWVYVQSTFDNGTYTNGTHILTVTGTTDTDGVVIGA